ncbi:ABC transporter permease [Erysipelothrix urinaevulpis]|nr:iron chelate uptake ABC transporter family permease subunit [Erysipelothrix urinaevulpis]
MSLNIQQHAISFIMKKREAYIVLCLLIVLSVISLFVGALPLRVYDLFAGNEEAIHLLVYSRLPRLLSILLSGFALAVAGLIMQKLAQNKFVSPSTAVTLDAGRFGLLLSLIVIPNTLFIHRVIFAFSFSILGTILFIYSVSKIKFKSMILVPLLGMTLGMIISSLTTFLALKYDLLQVINAYLLGSFTFVLEGKYEFLWLVIPILILIFIYMNTFNIMAFGEDFAANLGINFKKVQYLGIGLVSILSSSVLLTIGTLPFLGLLVPNIICIRYGDTGRLPLIMSGLIGASILLVCDIFARLILYPYELPVSLILGIIGSLTFAFMLIGKKDL